MQALVYGDGASGERQRLVKLLRLEVSVVVYSDN